MQLQLMPNGLENDCLMKLNGSMQPEVDWRGCDTPGEILSQRTMPIFIDIGRIMMNIAKVTV